MSSRVPTTVTSSGSASRAVSSAVVGPGRASYTAHSGPPRWSAVVPRGPAAGWAAAGSSASVAARAASAGAGDAPVTGSRRELRELAEDRGTGPVGELVGLHGHELGPGQALEPLDHLRGAEEVVA